MGDSHAARFYPGLRIAARDRYRLAQFTRNLCPAVLGINAGFNCDAANEYVFTQVRALKPDAVILFAFWQHYMATEEERESGLRELASTIDAIRKAGVPQIIVVGPAPEWDNTLPEDLLHDAVNHQAATLPQRTFNHMDVGDVQSMDGALRQRLAGMQGVTYFSVYRKLCDDSGCLTTVNGRPDGLTAYDYGHLTTPAATYVAQAMLKGTLIR